jgi:hypothetical protein
MKKVVLLIIPFLIAIVVFSIIIFLTAKNKDKGALQVTSVPAAKVYLNNLLIGQTPLCKCELKEMLYTGDYTVKVVPINGNFEPFEQKITISPKVLTVVDRTFDSHILSQGSIITLSAIEDKKDAQISVISFPDKAQVYLDNNLSGELPILLKNVTESDHELRLTRDGYKDKIIRIRTVLGYKLEALVFLGVNPEIATASAMQATSSAVQVARVLILATPTGFLRVRDQASLAGAEVSQIKPGETYDLLNEQAGWYQIKLTSGKSGWISSSYAQKQ